MSDRPPPQAQQDRGSADSSRTWRTWVAGLVAILALVFIVQNSQEVEVDFIFATTSTPLIFALLIIFAVGALVGWLLPWVRRRK